MLLEQVANALLSQQVRTSQARLQPNACSSAGSGAEPYRHPVHYSYAVDNMQDQAAQAMARHLPGMTQQSEPDGQSTFLPVIGIVALPHCKPAA